MFSQNVFSARDVLANSALNDNNTWSDSQQYSQPYSQMMYSSSQNSQMNSMENSSQQKVPISSKFDPYQSQTIEDEPPNYYSTYVNNTPLFPASSKNKELNRSIKALIEKEKQNVSMKEERDMLQTFINLLKDYTKEVNSSFQSLKNEMESTLQVIVQSTQDGTQRIDEKVTNMKQELIAILEAKDKESHDKHELNKNISEQYGTIKSMETKTDILEKQLDEMKIKESAYIDQKTKFQELEQKYSARNVNNWNAIQAPSFIGNTPSLSQPTEPLYAIQIPPLHYNDREDPRITFPNRGLSTSTGYRYNSQETFQPQPHDYSNLPISFQVDPMVNPIPNHAAPPNMAFSASNPPYSTTGPVQTAGTSYLGPQYPTSLNQTPFRPSQSYSATNMSNPTAYSKVNIGSPAQRSCGLNVSRRNSKRPKQSPMAMVKPQVRQPSPLIMDDEIFLCDVLSSPETTKTPESPLNWNKRDSFHNWTEPEKSTPFTVRSSGKKKGCRQEESAKRKRSSISMLGIPSDDSEVQEIKNELQTQSRRFSKRTKSVP